MPNSHATLNSLFSDIAQAIRDKKGESSSVKYVADDFPTAIAGIPTGGASMSSLVTVDCAWQTVTFTNLNIGSAELIFSPVQDAIGYVVVVNVLFVTSSNVLYTGVGTGTALLNSALSVLSSENAGLFSGISIRQAMGTGNYRAIATINKPAQASETRCMIGVYAIK